MPGLESPERTDHHERNASVEVRATQVISALRALELATLLHEICGAGGAEAGRVGQGKPFAFGGRLYFNRLNHFQKLALPGPDSQAGYIFSICPRGSESGRVGTGYRDVQT